MVLNWVLKNGVKKKKKKKKKGDMFSIPQESLCV